MIKIKIICDMCQKEIEAKNKVFCGDCYRKSYKEGRDLSKDEIEELREDREYLNKKIADGILITKDDLELIYKALCVYKEEYRRWCDKCVLREIPYKVSENITRDLCFAIWHEGILEEKK